MKQTLLLYHLFISVYCKSFDQLSLCFPLNLDLVFFFFEVHCLLFPLSSLRHSVCGAVRHASPSGSSSISASFSFTCKLLEVLQARQKFELAQAEIEMSCYGKGRSLIVVWSRTRQTVLEESALVFLVISILERDEKQRCFMDLLYFLLKFRILIHILDVTAHSSGLLRTNILHRKWKHNCPEMVSWRMSVKVHSACYKQFSACQV